jgi:hypothetical protein
MMEEQPFTWQLLRVISPQLGTPVQDYSAHALKFNYCNKQL